MNIPTSIDRTRGFQILGVLGGIFNFYSKVHRILCKQTVQDPDQKLHPGAADLGPYCLPMSHKRMLGLYELNDDKFIIHTSYQLHSQVKALQRKQRPRPGLFEHTG